MTGEASATEQLLHVAGQVAQTEWHAVEGVTRNHGNMDSVCQCVRNTRAFHHHDITTCSRSSVHCITVSLPLGLQYMSESAYQGYACAH